MLYRFDDLELNLGRRELTRRGKPVKLTRLSFKVLRALVEAAPDVVTHDRLIDQAWGENRVVSPENLSQRILMLRQALGDNAAEPRYIQGVHGEGFRLIPEVTQFPQDDVMAPAAPILSPPDEIPSPGSRSPAWPLTLAAVLVAVAIVLWANLPYRYDRQAEPTSDRGVTSIAVLPFTNFSPKPEHTFYAAGIHEEVLNQLANLTSLRVISRTTMLRFANTLKSIPEIAEQLEVDSLLEGTVRYADNRIRVTVQLVDGRSDEHRWSETYDRELRDIFDIESEIARDVAAALQQVISADTHSSATGTTPNLDAYLEYMRGRQAMIMRTPADLRSAISHFKSAARLDPNYALAWVGLADSTALLASYAGQDMRETFASRQEAIERALKSAPRSGEAWLAMADLNRARDRPLEAEEQYLRSISLKPTYGQAYHWYGNFLRQNGRPEEALLQYRKALKLDPMGPALNWEYAKNLWALGRVEKALEHLRSLIESEPDFTVAYTDFSLYLAQLGRIDEALYWISAAAEIDDSVISVRVIACDLLLELGDDNAAEQCLREAVADFPEIPTLPHRMELYLYRGQYTALVELMRQRVALEGSAWAESSLAFALLNNGDLAQARKIYSRLIPEYFGTGELQIGAGELDPAIISAIVLQQGGDTVRANYLFDQALEAMKSMHRTRGKGYGPWDIVVHVARGDHENAIASLREAIDMGWRRSWWRLRGPMFEEINKNTEWNALYAELQSDIAIQRTHYETHRGDGEYWRQM